jgi:hypothetical protein
MQRVAEVKTSWWSSNGHKFFAAAVITALAVFAGGWFTDAREVMHDALISIAVVALLPFAFIAAGLAIALVLTLIFSLPVALLDGDIGDVGGELVGELAIEGGGRMVPWYYRFFTRQRHPVFWGIPAGIVLGALLLWAGLALTRLPHERDTAAALQAANDKIEQVYKETGSFPPAAGGRLVIDGVTYRDGFGQPLVYEVGGAWKLAHWSLRSYGYDGKRSADDLCIGGKAKLSLSRDAYGDIQALRCE